MRLNVFLPVLPPSRRSLLGWLRRAVGLLGPSWAAAPLRRAIQVLSLGLFCVLFFYVCWPGAGPDAAQLNADGEFIEPELFLRLDPLASLSAAIASRAWVGSLVTAGILLAICLVVPRGFCGYVCPLGTLLDAFDWALGRRVRRLEVPRRGWWTHLRYYVLLAVVLAAVGGVTLSGLVAAMPLLTRGMLLIVAPLQQGALRGWDSLPPMHAGHIVSIVLFAGVFALGFLGQRLWCRAICPTGAIFSLANLLRLTSRKVRPTCNNCGQCAASCPFDAIKSDFTTRHTDCTFCQTCGGVCPVRAIDFTGRWSEAPAKSSGIDTGAGVSLSRRGFLGATAGALATVVGMRTVFATGNPRGHSASVRPPGALPEQEFLQRCARCGQCMKACPSNVLQPAGFTEGLEGLWTPQAVGDCAGCQPQCNNCGQVCPTGAIRALPLAEKQAARMGLAGIDEQTCLRCGLCVEVCPYEAVDGGDDGDEFALPMVLAERCVGCCTCQAACFDANVRREGALKVAAIRVLAGPGRDDRISSGSYVELRGRMQPDGR